MDEADRVAYLATLGPGSDIDHCGTPFSEDLLAQLVHALRDPTTGRPRFGRASLAGATFTGQASFHGVTFNGPAVFDKATFTGPVVFHGASFTDAAIFHEAYFTDAAAFDVATFADVASFGLATFTGPAGFRRATFAGPVQFPGAAFTGDAAFHDARFETAPWLGPLLSSGTVSLDRAVFEAPVTIVIGARELSLWRTRWASTAALRLRYASVDLTGAVLEYPVTLAAEPAPLPGPQGPLPEVGLAGGHAGVRVTRLSGVDAAHLTLTDVDLSGCRFAGAVHLDQLRMDGRITFARPPIGWYRRGLAPFQRTRRRTLAEEHHWRAAIEADPAPRQEPTAHEWQPGPHHPDLSRTPGPGTLAALYRQLRKALEDGKNEPGAADFYYGECEMRRYDRHDTPRAERALLTAYWVLSGYGLRATRALSWLGAAMAATIAVMVLWGLPTDDPKPTTTGRQVAVGQKVVLTTDTPDPVNPTGPLTERVTTERLEKSLRVVINSVVFRSSGQDLTTAGTYTEMASRLAEPVLLGLAVLAVRSRVKR